MNINDYKNEKKEYIKQNYKNNNHNDSQVNFIIDTIDKLDSIYEIDTFINIVTSRIKFGLKFDESPIYKELNNIYTYKKDKNLSFEFDNSPNHKLIIGDNYDALNNLLITHKNKIDVIYIDPPYNTGGTNLGYQDKFSKTAWLNFIKERLLLAYKLLSNDGVIFVSIDDNMQAYLKVLMDEIFGEDNFVCNFVRETKTGGGRFGKRYIQKDFDYVIVYSKNLKICSEFNKMNSEWDDYKYEDERGKYTLKHPLDGGAGNIAYTQDVVINDVIYKPRKGKHWSFSEKRIQFMLNNDFLVPKSNGLVYIKNYKDFEIGKNNNNDYVVLEKEDGISWTSSKLLNKKYNNSSGTKELNDILINNLFSYPKPSIMIKDLLSIINNKNAIVLDFFAGSGTTGQAVLELNKEDGGKREFILCTKEYDGENNENNIAIDICYERLYRINNGKSTNGDSFKWIENNEPYKNSLNVYWLEKQNISIFNDDIDNVLKNIDYNAYKDFDRNININENNIYEYFSNLLYRLKKE